jgi:hypothetical protein
MAPASGVGIAVGIAVGTNKSDPVVLPSRRELNVAGILSRADEVCRQARVRVADGAQRGGSGEQEWPSKAGCYVADDVVAWQVLGVALLLVGTFTPNAVSQLNTLLAQGDDGSADSILEEEADRDFINDRFW